MLTKYKKKILLFSKKLSYTPRWMLIKCKIKKSYTQEPKGKMFWKKKRFL